MAAGRTVTLTFLGDSKQLQTAMDEAGLSASKAADTIGTKVDGMSSKFGGGISKMGQSVESFTGIPVSGFFDKFGEKIDAADTKGQKFGQTMKTMGGAVAIGAVAGIAAVGAESLHLADQFEVASSALDTSIKNAGGNADALNPKIQATYSAMAKFGFTATESAQSLTVLTTATKNPTQAMGYMGLAADLARLKHISLSDAATTLAKTFAGSTKALTAMGLNLDLGSSKMKTIDGDTKALSTAQVAAQQVQEKVNDGALKGIAGYAALATAHEKVSDAQEKLTKDQTASVNIMDAVKDRVKGAADAYGKTLSGQLASARAQVENLGISFGTKLAPLVEKAVTVITKVVNFLSDHKEVLVAIAVIVGGALTAAFIAWAIPLVTAAAAMTVLEAPVWLVVLAVAALAAAAYEVVTHWSAISSFFTKLWHDVEKVFFDVIHDVEDIIKGWYPIILGIMTGGILLLPALIFKYWHQISDDASKILDDVVGFFTALPGRIVTALGDIVTTIWGALTSTVTWLDSNVVTPLLSYVTGIPGSIFNSLGDIVTTVWHGLTGTVTWLDANVVRPLISYWLGIPGSLFNALGNIVGTVFSGMSGAWSWIKTNVYDPVVNGFKGLPGDIASVLGSGLSVFDNVGKSIVNSVISGVNTIINTIDAGVGGISIFGWHPPGHIIPDIPPMALGGNLGMGQTALVGENGPELFTASSAGTITPNNQMGGVGGAVTNVFNLQTTADPHEIAAQVGWILR